MRDLDVNALKLDSAGLVAVVVQDAKSNKVLMLGYATPQTLMESLEIGKLVFFSRTRNQRWLKGETSGNYLNLVGLYQDCDADAVLALVNPVGPTCHTGSESCFEEHHD